MKRLAGTCEIHDQEALLQRSRCWLDWDLQEFAVEVRSTGKMSGTESFDPSNIKFLNAEFPSQSGCLKAASIPVSFRRNDPSMGAMSISDTVLARTIESVDLAIKWRFVCNEPIQLLSETVADEVIFSCKTKSTPCWIQLFDGYQVHPADFGLAAKNVLTFEDKNTFALGLALGSPLSVFMRQKGHEVTLYLNSVPIAARERPLFDRTKGNGFLDLEKYANGFAEVYRAAMDYQNQQADGGEQFRFATDAFLRARISNAGYVVQMLTAFQFLEWLNPDDKIKSAKSLESLLGVEEPVAEALKRLRNAYMHNQKRDGKTRERTDLLLETDKACDALVEVGYVPQVASQSARTRNLYNYVISLMQVHLLRHIGANVEPCPMIPGHGVFDLKSPQYV